MKNRILGIAVLLAAVVLGMAFVSCGPAEDTEVTFVNMTSVDVTVVSDGSPAAPVLLKRTSSTDAGSTITVKKTGGDLTITSFKFGDIDPDDWDEYLDIDISTMPSQKKPPKSGGITLGSGLVTFSGVKGLPYNPAWNFKISVIPSDE